MNKRADLLPGATEQYADIAARPVGQAPERNMGHPKLGCTRRPDYIKARGPSQSHCTHTRMHRDEVP